MERQLVPDYYEIEQGNSDKEYCKICGADLSGHICPNYTDEDHTDENYFL